MAKYTREIIGDFDEVLDVCERAIMRSMSASREESEAHYIGPVRIAVRVYERYSYLGGNRVSLSLFLAGDGERLWLSAVTSGGSQAVFWKLNTFGEQSFLDSLASAIEEYLGR